MPLRPKGGFYLIANIANIAKIANIQALGATPTPLPELQR
jgi:hypothetical protein